ncbi:MAG: hypothetical protein A2W91_10900 [Bacteroidetes bacterium GWF2_38_335]|nr:MAG: hypothetical protein A2W91_10900 [Bacteroidetes bacterium GWF2_38_335]OFY81791.1 MAG: hypothetical protein A2281_06140 [Bacteroidetes bacterium RIFOXYA12_FULL_38_20]HBS87861.1 hypothetical protein [Bacteroidales bacterium]
MEKIIDLKKQRNKYILVIILLAIANLLIYNIFNRNGGYNMRGEYIEYSFIQALKSSLIMIFIGIPVASHLLSLVFSMIPYKGLDYKKKYFRTTLLVIIVIYSLLFVIQIISYSVIQRDSDFNSNVKQSDKLVEFKNEMISLKDSSVNYFEMAIAESKTSDDLFEISKKYSPKLNLYQHKIDSLSLKFHSKLNEYGLTQSDYESIIKEVKNEFSVLLEKYDEYKKSGLVILK